jgi:hypothetical protein
MADLLKSPIAMFHFVRLMKKGMKGKKTMVDSKSMGNIMSNKSMIAFMSGFTVKRLLSMMGAMGGAPIGKEDMLKFNARLNKIRKHK